MMTENCEVVREIGSFAAAPMGSAPQLAKKRRERRAQLLVVAAVALEDVGDVNFLLFPICPFSLNA